jgi:hypothetical protein
LYLRRFSDQDTDKGQRSDYQHNPPENSHDVLARFPKSALFPLGRACAVLGLKTKYANAIISAIHIASDIHIRCSLLNAIVAP